MDRVQRDLRAHRSTHRRRRLRQDEATEDPVAVEPAWVTAGESVAAELDDVETLVDGAGIVERHDAAA